MKKTHKTAVAAHMSSLLVERYYHYQSSQQRVPLPVGQRLLPKKKQQKPLNVFWLPVHSAMIAPGQKAVFQ
jgi:hypothetical protein